MPLLPLHPICLGCRRTCKQWAFVTLVACPVYWPIKAESNTPTQNQDNPKDSNEQSAFDKALEYNLDEVTLDSQ